jgi:hypothetical protein
MRFNYLIALAAFAISIYAAFSFVGEYRAGRLSLTSETTTFRTLLDAPPRRPGSLFADQRIFLACHKALTGKVAKLQPDTALQAITDYCQNQARGALRSSPSSTLAHYTLALTAMASGQSDVANAELLASQQNGPFEGWIAKRRFKLALNLGDKLDGDGISALDGDITALLQSPKGRKFLAKYYAARPALQDRILNLAGKQGEGVQAGLLKEITKALTAKAGGA